MKRIALALCLALPACHFGSVLTNGSTPANATTLDEKLGVGAEATYQTGNKLGAALVTAGLMDKAKFKDADNKAYTALLAVRAAYKAGNATDYATAVAQVNAAVAEIRALVK